MRMILCISLLIIALSINSAKAENVDINPTQLFITIEDQSEIVPDTLKMTLNINVVTQKETDAINILGGMDKHIKKLNQEYKGGRYSVVKNCWWTNNQEKCSGYKGSINYSFFLKDGKEQNSILELMDQLKQKYDSKLSYSVSEPIWITSEKNIKDLSDSLKLSIIDSAKHFAQKVSEKLDKRCDISSINYETRQPYFWDFEPIMMKTAEKSIVHAPEPTKDKNIVKVKASVTIICK